MKFLKRRFFFLNILFFINTAVHLFADDLNDQANAALDNLKSVWDGASGFVTGIGESFGYVPDNYRYSFQVWNDSPAVIFAAAQIITKVLGAGFQGEVKDYRYLNPYSNSDTVFLNEKLYFTIWMIYDQTNSDYAQYQSKIEDYAKIGAEAASPLGAAIGALAGAIETTEALEKYSFFSKDISTPVDPSIVSYYHAYTNAGDIKGEYLGAKTTTNEFSGVFYNSSDTDIAMQFMKDGVTYKATLEHGNTFCLLNSSTSKPNSIRPPDDDPKNQRAFTFFNGSQQIAALPIKSLGICNVQQDPKDPKSTKLLPGAPMVYTYEVSKGKSGGIAVSMQGLAIGNYTQPIDHNDYKRNVVRDINPMKCHVRFQSAKQAQDDAKKDKDYDPTQFFIDTSDSVWLFYKTKDYIFQKKITPGQVLDFTLLRPQISENVVRFFCVSLQTQDDTKALAFLNNLADGKIGKDALTLQTPVLKFDENTVLTSIQPNTRGIIDDTSGSGVKGYILFSDSIKAQGVGTGPFYYSLKPSIAMISQLVDIVGAYVDPKKYNPTTAMQNDIITNIEKWILEYPKNKSQVATELTTYLQDKGVDEIITNTASPQRTLNENGKNGVQMLVDGAISIGRYPRLQQSGINQYVYYLGSKPDGWPS